ncbi:hypothetical protein P152DRAFT_460903 [Eremomyces bilateralis CBS 781.70]|uniref:TFIIS N-terminal domain-containing protein n=1 Tax=Eremomyces bilateralis CBS 781.70 TaxID=1392243 RepID=A0A6G1FWN8_9PEZI|nr:uncharacterized protein P152DRAFT_460903 [Eremomyces bilateralis CBS 781.70]KAF1810101.1 hypothetical protein P152DRAFT_460903 [Eremomyces bilateralis CBS 781.70]
MEGSRRERKKKGEGERKRGRVQKEVDTDEEQLEPKERRKRALDRKMDEALKSTSRRGKQSGLEFEAMIDREIENMRGKMIEAAKADAEAREANKPAIHKLELLPAVIGLLNRDKFGSELVDPDINLLEAVRFFLEPLADGSLPAYQIQKQLFDVLERLPIKTESLTSSGIGKVTHFYTKSNRPQADIKRQADRLVAAWTRPILRRNADFRKRDIQQVQYDPSHHPTPSSADLSADLQAQAAARRREQLLATPTYMNRARVENNAASYSVAPRSNYVPVQAAESGGGDVMKRIMARHAVQSGKASRKR